VGRGCRRRVVLHRTRTRNTRRPHSHTGDLQNSLSESFPLGLVPPCDSGGIQQHPASESRIVSLVELRINGIPICDFLAPCRYTQRVAPAITQHRKSGRSRVREA
jgi:hypothetical protein